MFYAYDLFPDKYTTQKIHDQALVYVAFLKNYHFFFFNFKALRIKNITLYINSLNILTWC